MPAEDETIVTSRPAAAEPTGRGDRPAPCRNRPNCVSTRSTDALHHIAPIPFLGSVDGARERLLEVLRSLPRTRVAAAEARYVRAEIRTRICRFADDAEFFFDETAKVIELRSAARLGYRDFGVNRRNMETVRREFLLRQGGG